MVSGSAYSWPAALEPFASLMERGLAELQDRWVLYTVWAGLFVATVLLLRMLITRWGDSRVTMKAVVLSLIVHLVAGLWTTTVRLATDASEPRTARSMPVRKLVVEGQKTPPQKSPGNTPVWQKPPEREREEPTRIEKPVVTIAEAEPRREPRDDERPEMRLPELAMRPDEPAESPEPVRSEERPASPVRNDPQKIDETTAELRPDAIPEPAFSPRAARETSGVKETVTERPTRAGLPLDAALNRDLPREAAMLPSVTTPDPAARRGTDDAPRSRPAAIAAQSLDEPGIDTPAAVETRGAGNPEPTPFTRLGQRSKTESPGGAVARVRPTSPAPSDAVDLSRTPVVASRSGTGTGLEMNGPRSVRPEPGPSMRGEAAKVPATYRLRNLPERKRIAMEMGATEESERAVELSLEWLAQHQNPQGFWDPDGFTLQCPPNDRCEGLAGLGRDPLDPKLNTPERQRSGIEADAGITALAVLAFLGAGYTQEEGQYADTVDRALRWLISQQSADGSLAGNSGRYARMYCHGMATIALGEGYGLTNDPNLREPLERAVRFIVRNQNPADGGWRYEKGQVGDMSIFGWQLMGLKSAVTARVEVPQASISAAIGFLQAGGRGEFKGLHGYGSIQGDDRVRPAMTAEALFCKQMLGIKRTNPAVNEAVEYLLQNLPRRSKMDLYYWYYGTLAMYHHGGEPWKQWNGALRDILVADQRKDGHAAGSWDPRAPWGDYGGRVYSTAVSTLCLEVYYRFLPLYQIGNQPASTSRN